MDGMVHVDVHGKFVVGDCNLIMADNGLSDMKKLLECVLKCELCCELLLLLNINICMVDVKGCGVSS